MNYLGDFPAGSTIYIPFATYDKDDGSSITLTGLAVTDIEVYKNGSTTQRASDAGFSLLDTDGIDFDGITGIHGFSIDTSDDTTSGFFAAGNDYWVVVSSITVDGVIVNFIAATFSIENRRVAGELARTTIATLASQTSFTLSTASANNNAYVGCTIVVTSKTGGTQKCVGYISAYTGSTRTVTLAADPGIFTMAAGDNVSILAGVNVKAIGSTVQTGRDIGASVLLSSGSGTGQLDFTSGVVKANLVQILASALSGTAAQIAAAFVKFFDKSSPTGTVNSLPDAVAGASGGLPTTNGTKLNQTVDITASQVQVKKNAALSNFVFPMFDSAGALKTGLTVTVSLSKDGGSFATSSNSSSEIGTTGWYKIDLTQTEMNANTIAFSATASGAVPTAYTIITQA